MRCCLHVATERLLPEPGTVQRLGLLRLHGVGRRVPSWEPLSGRVAPELGQERWGGEVKTVKKLGTGPAVRIK